MTLFLIASGVTLVIMIGGIDLSIQSVASMASCILAVNLPRLGFAAVPLAILGGAVAGFLGGIVSTRLRIPSFIATLAVSGVVTSAGYWFSSERSVNISAEDSAKNLSWAVAEIAGIPNEIWLGIFFLAILSAILGLTPFGRLVRAIGTLRIGLPDARERIPAARHRLHRRRRHGDHRGRRLDLANFCRGLDRPGRQDRHDVHRRQRFCPADRLRVYPGGGGGDHYGP
jgi:ABC-type xylose transport system permease subunit